MYIPASFRVDDPAQLAAFMQEHSFATLVTHDGQSPFATHLPVLLDAHRGAHGTLLAHVARANPQWRHFQPGAEVLFLFQGPHAYISPTWYETSPAVPTWNYTAVHAYGIPAILGDPARIQDLLDRLVLQYEAPLPHPWDGVLPDDYRKRMVEGIVAFEVPLSRVEGKFKLGQNRAPADYAGVIRALGASAHPGDRELAECMQRAAQSGSPHR